MPRLIIDEAHALELLGRAVLDRNDPKTGTGGQVAVGQELGCSPSLICQLLSGDYPESSKGKWYQLIVERYGNETVPCPALGEIPLIICAEERAKPSGIAPSAAYVRQRQICKKCERK